VVSTLVSRVGGRTGSPFIWFQTMALKAAFPLVLYVYCPSTVRMLHVSVKMHFRVSTSPVRILSVSVISYDTVKNNVVSNNNFL
jgi:hypothetical protein